MRKFNFCAALFLCALSVFPAFSQDTDYSHQKEVTDRFLVPIESYNGFAGTYGELRGNHFHCGLDMRTGGVEGKKIYAADDGYVSRITIGPWGYGNMIEITHPSGYKTIYGHLKSFAPKYKKLVIKKQYEEESWGQHIDFPKDSLPVKRGDLIAYSGNTGSSGGPHLHFEVLDENGTPVNLQITGIFNLKDNENPVIRDVRIVGCAPFYGTLYTFPVESKGDTVKVPKSFYIAVDSYDVMAGTPGKLAVYKYETFLDGESFFRFEEGNIPYSEGRYIASLLDHPLRRSTGRYFVKTQIDPNNGLAGRIKAENDGIVSIVDTLIHLLRIEVTDVYGNKTVKEINVARCDSLFSGSVPFSPKGEFAAWDKDNKYVFDGLSVLIPEKALFRNAFFYAIRERDSYAPEKNIPAMSPLWSVGDENIPLNKSVTLTLRCSVPAMYLSKVIVARVGRGGSLSSVGGTLNALTNEMTASVSSFGNYCVTADMEAPEISIRLKEGAAVKESSIKITLKDRLSGIRKFRCEIDGHWVVAPLDGKTSTVEIPLADARIAKGKRHRLKVEAEDNVGNKSMAEKNFTW
jgi:murein DD-endopeptidase MepM/ murein hydrolase activator NlpD